MSINKTLVVLAGGLGSRYKGLKQVDAILEKGSTILEYSVYDAIKNGFNKFVFVINEKIPEMFVNHISRILLDNHLECHWIIQKNDSFVTNQKALDSREKPWGTAHAVLCTKDVVKENFLVVNADDFYGRQSYVMASKLIDDGLITNRSYGIICYLLKNTLSENGFVSRGICNVENGYLKSVVEQTKIIEENNQIVCCNDLDRITLNQETPVSMNFWIFNPSIFDYLEHDFELFIQSNPSDNQELYLPACVDQLIQNNAVDVVAKSSSASWKGVTYPEDKVILQKFIQDQVNLGIYPQDLWS